MNKIVHLTDTLEQKKERLSWGDSPSHVSNREITLFNAQESLIIFMLLGLIGTRFLIIWLYGIIKDVSYCLNCYQVTRLLSQMHQSLGYLRPEREDRVY